MSETVASEKTHYETDGLKLAHGVLAVPVAHLRLGGEPVPVSLNLILEPCYHLVGNIFAEKFPAHGTLKLQSSADCTLDDAVDYAASYRILRKEV